MGETKIRVYNDLGSLEKELDTSAFDSKNIKPYNISFLYDGKGEFLSIEGYNVDNKTVIFSTETGKYKILNNTFEEVNKDITSSRFIQGISKVAYPETLYVFKLRIENLLNREDVKDIIFKVDTNHLNTGKHHFCLVYNSVEGFIKLFIDGSLHSKEDFTPNKYALVDIFKNDILFGTTVFKGGVKYQDFYKDDILYLNDSEIGKINLYNTSLNNDEVKLLYYQISEPGTLRVSLKLGERNYIDTIKRVFRHKKPGFKANLIDIYINDLEEIDLSKRQSLKSEIENDIKKSLPSYVKLNNIYWNDNRKDLQ